MEAVELSQENNLNLEDGDTHIGEEEVEEVIQKQMK